MPFYIITILGVGFLVFATTAMASEESRLAVAENQLTTVLR